jgi:RsiW-degrading membrane proteinase PrsW (M82 family)
MADLSATLRLDELIAALGPAFLGGLIPALVWLAFWLREDGDHPEPRRAVFTTFVLGAAAIPGTMVVQLVASKLFLQGADIHAAAAWAPAAALVTLVVWVVTEEIAKLVAAYAGGLSKRELDEPIDAAVYLIAAALGFSAAENFFYVFNEVYFQGGQVAAAIMTGSTRAVGATTLHVAVAAVLGVFGGYAHFATPKVQRALWIGGFTLVSLLHLSFNALIIFGGSAGANAVAFGISWLVSLGAIVALEKLKSMRVESAERATKNTQHG